MTLFTTGKFDVLHYGHFKFLNHLFLQLDDEKWCDFIVIMVDSDSRISETTGAPPVFTAGERVLALQELAITCQPSNRNKIFFHVFDSDDDLCEAYTTGKRSDNEVYLVKGSEWRGKPIVGEKIVKDVFFYDNKGADKISSSFIKTRIIQWHQASNMNSIKSI